MINLHQRQKPLFPLYQAKKAALAAYRSSFSHFVVTCGEVVSRPSGTRKDNKRETLAGYSFATSRGLNLTFARDFHAPVLIKERTAPRHRLPGPGSGLAACASQRARSVATALARSTKRDRCRADRAGCPCPQECPPFWMPIRFFLRLFSAAVPAEKCRRRPKEKRDAGGVRGDGGEKENTRRGSRPKSLRSTSRGVFAPSRGVPRW